MSQDSERCIWDAYSRAHLYGSKTKILGRAHVWRLKGTFFAAIFAGCGGQWLWIVADNFLDQEVEIGALLAGS